MYDMFFYLAAFLEQNVRLEKYQKRSAAMDPINRGTLLGQTSCLLFAPEHSSQSMTRWLQGLQARTTTCLIEECGPFQVLVSQSLTFSDSLVRRRC